MSNTSPALWRTVFSSLFQKRKNQNHTTPWGVENKRVPSTEFNCTELVTSGILELCYIVKILFLVLGHGRIVVDLNVICLHLLTSATLAFATAAAVLAAARQARGHHGVPRCHWVQGAWQEVPRAQHPGQAVRPAALHHIDDDDHNEQRHEGHGHAHQDLPAGHGQAKYGQGKYQEAKDEVKDGKPAVLGCAVPQPSGQPDGQPHERDGVPNCNAKNVEEEMAECNLKENIRENEKRLFLESAYWIKTPSPGSNFFTISSTLQNGKRGIDHQTKDNVLLFVFCLWMTIKS